MSLTKSFLLILLILLFHCNTLHPNNSNKSQVVVSEDKIKITNESIESKETEKRSEITDTISESVKPQLVTKEEIEMINQYKDISKKEEEEYQNKYQSFLPIKQAIINHKQRSDLQNQEYEKFRTEIIAKKLDSKQSRIERLNRIDPERNAFWRKEANERFPENLVFTVDESTSYYICEIQDPIVHLHLKKYQCNSLVKKINYQFLLNRNFFEEVSIFEILPSRKSYYIILIEKGKVLERLTLQDNKNTTFQLAFLEYNGGILLKLYLFSKPSSAKRIQFLLISPLDLIFQNKL
ncbi:MAG: hypothetical protein RMI35_06560 [Leptospiraceae bacterium]|nr:hypothetical protein [Leptospiraceae bacterium]